MSYAINKIVVDCDSQICAAGYAAHKGFTDEEIKAGQVPVSTSIACLIGLQSAQWSWMMNHIGKGQKKNRAGEITKEEDRAQDWLAQGKLEFGLSADDGTNFRKDVATIKEYKGNRDPSSKPANYQALRQWVIAVSYTHLRAHETGRNLVCRLLLEKKK